MSRNRKKKFTPILIIIALTIILWGSISLWDYHIESTQIRGDNFFEHDISQLHGGKEAQQFFDEYADLGSCIDAKFYYRDSGRQISTLYNRWTVFVVDAYYEENHFREIINTVLIDTNLVDYYDANKDGDVFEYLVKNYDEAQFGEDQFLACECEITKAEPLYQNNTAGFFIDLKNHTVRYAFLYDSNYNLYDGVPMSIDLPWNQNENDYAFDYCAP